MIDSTSDSFIGTASDFISRNATFNGARLEPVSFSILSRHGVIAVVGTEQKVQGKRGKPGSIFKISKSFVKLEG